ncbi:MAG: nucleoside triphosphate pyrophosphohydrolase, partial [Steroidobacteraceae bacterium]
MSEAESAVSALLELMRKLRDPESGCPWDQKQTFASVAPYTIEEAYEVADAIERGDRGQLRDELGDLLFQVVFHAQLAQERGWFDFAQVASAIHDKLVRRHPHVFAGKSVSDDAELSHNWEEQKARERVTVAVERGQEGAAGARAHVSALADVPRGLPALVRAGKLGRRARRVGFDWADARQVRDKVLEELHETDAALATAAASNAPAVIEEMGDLLFALANWSRHLRFDAEGALRAANSKFERRFGYMESLARLRGLALDRLSPGEWEGLW